MPSNPPCQQLGSCPFPPNCSKSYSITKNIKIVTFIEIKKKTSVHFVNCNGEPVDKIIAQGTTRTAETTSLSVSYMCTCPGGRTTCIQNPNTCAAWNARLAEHQAKVDKKIAENTFLDCPEDDGGYCPPVYGRCGVLVRAGRWIKRITCKESIATEAGQICIGNGCSC